MGPRPGPLALWRVLAVFLVAFSATTSLMLGGVAAAVGPACTLGATSGVVGQQVSVTCSGFQANENAQIYWDEKTSNGLIGAFRLDANGAGSSTYAIRDGVTGDHTMYAVGQTSAGEVSMTFTVNPNMVVGITSGKVGASASVTLTGFGASESVALTWFHDPMTSVVLKTATASNKGRVLTSVIIPKSVVGAHTLVADGAVAPSDPSASFTVVPGVSLTPSSGGVGRSTTVKLDGYAAGEAIAVNWVQSGVPANMANVTADSVGSASVAITVPTVAKGTYDVQGDGATNDAVGTYTVTPEISIPLTQLVVHENLTVTMQGLSASTAVTVKWYDGSTTSTASAVVATTTTSASGTGSVTFEVPDAAKGSHRVEVVAGSDTLFKNAWVKPSLALEPATGESGDTVTAHLHGYVADETVTIVWSHGLGSSSTVATGAANAKGSADITFVVPTGDADGDHTVTGDASTDATAIFTLDNPAINLPADCTLQTTSAPIGSNLQVSCTNYDAGETVNVYLDSAASTSLGSFVADDAGAGSTTIVVPSTTTGAHSIVTKGATSLETTSDALTVTLLDCVLSDGNGTAGIQGVVGATITFACTGFYPNATVQVYWDVTTGFPMVTVTADANGAASGSFTIPEAPKGAHSVISKSPQGGLQTADTVTVDPSMSLSLSSAAANTGVSVSLKGFGNKESVVIAWVDGATVTTLKTATTLTSGSLYTSFQVPVVPGKTTYKVRATGQSTGAVLETSFTVVTSMGLSPNAGTPTSSVIATIRGFKANETVTLRWYHAYPGTPVTLNGAGGTADANGTYTFTFIVPNAVTGLHRVEAVGGNGSLATRDFTVNQAITLAKNYGTVGSTVTVTLNGWGNAESVKVEWENNGTWTQVSGSPFTMNQSGRAQFTLTVPETFNGVHNIRATGLTSNVAKSKTFTVNASVALSPASGPVGTTVTVTMKGFDASDTVTVRYYTSPTTPVTVATKALNASGSGTVTFAIPASTATKHKVEVVGSTPPVKASGYFQVTP